MSFPTPAPASRLLLVSDDVSVSDMLCLTLRLEGLEVWSALSVSEGLTLADRHRPQAVIVDVRMPLSGVAEQIRHLRRLSGLAHVPVAVVTGDYYVNDEQADVMRSLGVTLHFKPMWLREMEDVARALVHAAVAL